MSYLPSRRAAARLGLHPQTLRRYARQGKIPFYRNSGGQRLYDADSCLRGQADPETICYCRVSSAKQRGDLQRQVAHMRELFPTAQVVTDVAGGLNWKRKGLLSILEQLHRGAKLTIVVAHRHRLARFGPKPLLPASMSERLARPFVPSPHQMAYQRHGPGPGQKHPRRANTGSPFLFHNEAKGQRPLPHTTTLQKNQPMGQTTGNIGEGGPKIDRIKKLLHKK